MYGNTAPLNATIELRVELGGRDDARPMSHPPDDLEDGDPFLEWERENAATSIDLLPVDLAEIEREESTPTRTVEKLPGYDVGRRVGEREERERVLAAVGAILLARHRVGRVEVDQFLDLVREKLRQPAPIRP